MWPDAEAAVTAAGEWVWLARIRRPQGRKGEVFADILTDFPEKFAQRCRLWLLAEDAASRDSRPAGAAKVPAGPRAAELISHWLHKGGVVLHFSGTESISDAELLAGIIVAITRNDRAALCGVEVYIADLIGCTLVDVAHVGVSGATPGIIGEIEDVDQTAGPVALLVVRGPAGEILIPFAKSYLRKLDLENKRVEMALPEGLADLNAT